MLNAALDLCIVSLEQASLELPGSPIGSIEGINSTVRSKVNAFKIRESKLHQLHAHDVFCLRHAYSIPTII